MKRYKYIASFLISVLLILPLEIFARTVTTLDITNNTGKTLYIFSSKIYSGKHWRVGQHPPKVINNGERVKIAVTNPRFPHVHFAISFSLDQNDTENACRLSVSQSVIDAANASLTCDHHNNDLLTIWILSDTAAPGSTFGTAKVILRG